MANQQDGKGTPGGTYALAASLESMFNNPSYSDLTVKCGNTSWSVHKVIVCARSTYFAKACGGYFKEAHDGVITLSEDDPDVVEAMLHWLYTASYPVQVPAALKSDGMIMVLHARVAIAADKYDLPNLIELATARFKVCAKQGWVLDQFAVAAELVFSVKMERLETLREAIVEVMTENAKEVAEAEEHARLRNVVSELPALAAALWVAVATKTKPKIWRYACPLRVGSFSHPCNGKLKLESPISEDSEYLCRGCHHYSQGSSWSEITATSQ